MTSLCHWSTRIRLSDDAAAADITFVVEPHSRLPLCNRTVWNLVSLTAPLVDAVAVVVVGAAVAAAVDNFAFASDSLGNLGNFPCVLVGWGLRCCWLENPAVEMVLEDGTTVSVANSWESAALATNDYFEGYELHPLTNWEGNPE